MNEGHRRFAHFPAGALFLLAIFLFGGCVVSRNPITGRSRAYGYSWQQEIQIGRDADQSIAAEYGLYDDPAVAAWVDSLGQVLVSHSHLRRPDAAPEFQATEFHFRVLDSPVINAFALPGGYVYVTRGLLTHLENEAQLAVVLGHEIGHVAARHGSKRAATQMLGQALLIGSAVGGQAIFGDDIGSTILQLGSTAAQLLFLSYGRDDERESDDLGVQYASLAGYDASQASAFFGTLRRLGEQSGQSIPSFMSTHPDPGEREQEMIRLASEQPNAATARMIKKERMMSGINGMVAGENPRQGFVDNGTFYLPDLAVQFPVPNNFQTVNQASRVVLVGPEQAALVIFSIESGVQTAREAAERFASQEGLTVIQSGLGSANGIAAQYVVAEAADENGAITRVRAHYAAYNGRVYSFLGLAAQANFGNWDPSFQSTMQGFAPLRDNRILGIQPARVAVVNADRTAPFQSFVGSAGVGGFDAEGLAILNQLNLNQSIPAGTLFKLVR